MNFKFISITNPNTVTISSSKFLSELNKPLLMKLYPTNLIISFLMFLKVEIIRLKDILKAAVIYLLRPLFPTTVIKKMIITAVF